MTNFFVLTDNLEKWNEHNGGLSIAEHVKAIVWHSNRVGKLQTEFLMYDDPEHGRDLLVGMWFEHKANSDQIALAEAQSIVSNAIDYHELCIRLHTQGATKTGTYRQRKRCALRFLDAALEKLNQEKEQAR